MGVDNFEKRRTFSDVTDGAITFLCTY